MALFRCSSSCASSTSLIPVVLHLALGLLLVWSELAGAAGFEPLIELPNFKRGARRARTMRSVSVVDHGAKGNGLNDDTEAFVQAWKLVCSSKVGATLKVPTGNAYLLRPITFGGPCKSKIVLSVMGTIIAPSDPDMWYRLHPRRWLYFHGIKDLEVRGEGVIDGSGQGWWARSCKTNASNPCRSAPTAMTFHRMRRLTVQGLTIVNAQQMHISFTDSYEVQVSSLKVIAPERSPNTDGIHLSSCVSVAVEDSIISTGDDCVSIVGNSSSILIKNMVCGPGHGISIGSLGQNKANDQVQDILVDEAFVSNTENGVRIKTWQGGQGHARNIIFRNILMRNVSNPILVDQYYCDSSLPCRNQTSAVKVENVAFIDIKGTSATEEAIKLACSDSYPCKKILLKNIELSYYSGGDAAAYCWKASGFSSGEVYPPSCLSDSDQPIQKITSSSLLLYSSA
ncbi:hypothetical protein HPP92_023164 [Vanilla planifolia]|uniref:endo-polygalacturonase n=1 Tax=Vanilla planifolia TaxID=51239 RepID=A0A835PXY4_VANPL|nr:hypothetical protein HPP92_023164 [Vanilla planifolia]